MLFGIRWGSLRNKILAWSFVPTAIILTAVAWVTFSAYQRVTEDLVIVRNQELARFSAGEFATGLTEYTGLLTEYAGLLGGLPPIAYADESDLIVQRDVLMRARSRFEVFDGGVLILSNQGTVVATEPERPEILGQNWSNRSYFRHMLRSPRPVFSDIVADGPQGAEAIVVGVPIKGDHGQFLGLMAGMFRLGATAINPFYRDITRLRIGESGSTYLVDSAGRAIHHSDPDLIGDGLSSQATVQQVLAGEVGALRTRDVEGRDIVASFAPVPGTPWGLVGEETWAALTSGIRGYQRFLLLLLVLGVVIPALVVTFGVKRITKPITELIGAAQEMAGGNFGQTISARTGDEIEELAEQFNRMAAHLQESYAHLEQRVADRTKEMATLNAIAATVSQSLDLNEILDDALDKTLQVMEIEAGGVYLLDEEDDGVLTIAAQRGFSPGFVEEIDRLRVGEGFSGHVVQSGHPLVVRDASTDPRLTRMVVREEKLRSLASVPLISKGKVLGTLFAITRGYREFTDQDVQLLTSIGHQIGVAVENAGLYEDTKSRLAQLSALQETTRAVASTLELDRLLNLLVQQAATLLQADGGILNLVDWEKNEDEAVACTGLAASVVGSRSPLEGGLSGWVTLHNQPLISDQLQDDSRVDRRGLARMEDGTKKQIQNAALAPLTIKDQVMGTLVVVDKQGGRGKFDQSDLDLLVAFANQAATALENAHLFEAEGERRREATLLAEMAKLISGTLDLDEVLRLTAEYAVDVFDVQCCCVFLYDEAKETLRPAVYIGIDNKVAAALAELAEADHEVGFSPSERMRRTVFESLQPLIIEDVPSEPHLSPSDLLDLQSALVVPIEVGGRRLGAMQLATRPPRRRRFTDHEGELALAMANQAAVVIENARLFDAEQRRSEQFRVISEVGRQVTSILAVDELMAQMTRLIQEAFDYYHVGIGLIEGDEVVYKVGAGVVWDDSRFQFEPSRLKVGQEGITGWVAAMGEPLLVQDVSQEPRYVWMRGSKTRSELAVPIKAKGQIIGVLDVQSDHLDAFDESDLVVLQSLAHQAAIAIENARLYEQAQQLAVMEERSRLARELHDAVTQTLFSASLIAETLPALWESDQDEGRQLLQELRKLNRGAMAEMRTLLLELRPTALAEASLDDLLRQLGEAVTGRTGVPVTMTVEGECALPEDVHVALYRIAQEALNNVAKHARASHVAMSLRCFPRGDGEGEGERESIELRVTDDGRGFEPSDVEPGEMGLGIMQERVLSIGAKLEIQSQLGHGTQVTVGWTNDE